MAALFSQLCPADTVSPVVSNSLWPHSLPGSSVHGILQARILEWVAIPFSRGSSWTRDQTQISPITGKVFTIWATREGDSASYSWQKSSGSFSSFIPCIQSTISILLILFPRYISNIPTSLLVHFHNCSLSHPIVLPRLLRHLFFFHSGPAQYISYVASSMSSKTGEPDDVTPFLKRTSGYNNFLSIAELVMYFHR